MSSETAAVEQAARKVRRGEWTSYGDISAAVFGTKRRARLVGTLAAASDSFPHPHRVLTHDGAVSRGRHRAAEARARARLLEEGVSFGPSGRADPARRVHWDELGRRLGHTARRPAER